MQFLAYYWATDMLQVEVINGNEKGSNLQFINNFIDLMKQKHSHFHLLKSAQISDGNQNIKIQDKIFPNKQNYVFLDHSNGDFYWFKSSESESSSNNHEEISNSTNFWGMYYFFVS